MIRANVRSLGLINGQVLTVGKIESDGSLDTREGISVPATFKQWTHGYVVTSHKEQGRTCERVVVAAARLDAKSSYVACSRGRESCSVHTPDKAAITAHLPEGNRKSALDVLATNPPKNLNADLRSTAYREITAEIRRIRAGMNRRTEQMRHMVRRHDQHRQRASITESVSGPKQTPAESARPITTSAPCNPKEPGSAFKLNPERKFMALKTKDGTFDSKPANYERDTHPAGINFELKDGTALFAPCSFLSYALYRSDEIVIHYSFGVVRVRGERLGPIFTMIRGHELASINCAMDKIAKPEDPHIRDISFEHADELD